MCLCDIPFITSNTSEYFNSLPSPNNVDLISLKASLDLPLRKYGFTQLNLQSMYEVCCVSFPGCSSSSLFGRSIKVAT